MRRPSTDSKDLLYSVNQLILRAITESSGLSNVQGSKTVSTNKRENTIYKVASRLWGWVGSESGKPLLPLLAVLLSVVALVWNGIQDHKKLETQKLLGTPSMLNQNKLISKDKWERDAQLRAAQQLGVEISEYLILASRAHADIESHFAEEMKATTTRVLETIERLKLNSADYISNSTLSYHPYWLELKAQDANLKQRKLPTINLFRLFRDLENLKPGLIAMHVEISLYGNIAAQAGFFLDSRDTTRPELYAILYKALQEVVDYFARFESRHDEQLIETQVQPYMGQSVRASLLSLYQRCIEISHRYSVYDEVYYGTFKSTLPGNDLGSIGSSLPVGVKIKL